MNNRGQSASHILAQISGIAAGVVLVLVFAVVPLQASTITGSAGLPLEPITLNGTFHGVSTLMPTSTPGIFHGSFTGDGNDATFGAFVPTSTSTFDFSHPPNITVLTADISQVFANGTLHGTGSGQGTGNGQGMATFTLNFDITEGTGIFASDKGTLIVTGTIIQTSPTTETVTASYTGLLTPVPEPSTLVLLATGLFGFGLQRRRKI